ncbi:adenosylcobinamide-phosphate synthase CbiB [Pontivivens ytuae]|uniref:Cobalamin biosynthesis protein CobD n=1 Tax=Pontivivens ytuae TaxID=2789856 RepID=A0A7S9LP89_9RHOB|nr:adenosylcobinamide-phosphate synthase CbiB [Pontivivens ytuae]QPH52771.1 cobalamin biosynthesis protein [Pontivivens ytuae]
MSTVALALGMALDAIVGEPKALWSKVPHPAVLMGRAVEALDARFNKDRRRDGVLAVAILAVGAIVLGWLIDVILFLPLEFLVVAVFLAQRSLVDHVRAVATGLDESLEAGRAAVAQIVGRDTTVLDESGVARAAIESGAENLSDGVIAPAFWYLVAGLPGLLLYKAVNTADSMIGHRTPRHARFGWAAAKLDDVMNYVPARLTGLLIGIVALSDSAIKTMLEDAREHRSPNAGWPEAAMAGALDIALSGPRIYAEGPSDDPWLNVHGRKTADAEDVRHCVSLMWRTWAVALGLLVLFAVLFVL